MKYHQRRRIGFAMLFVVLACPVWAQHRFEEPQRLGPVTPVEGDEEATGASLSESARVLTLPLRLRVAQLMIVTLEGSPGPLVTDNEMLKRYPPGGILLPPMTQPKTVTDYVTKLRGMPLESATGVPLFIGADLHSLPKMNWGPEEYFPPLPSLLALAAIKDLDAVQIAATLMADQAALLGLNLYFGPPLSLAPELPDMPGSVNCFGSDPSFAAEAGLALIGTLRDRGIASVPVGFPGGGLNRPERGPAVLLSSGEALKRRDLLPFRQAIEAGVPLIHVGNTLVPRIDSGNGPASLSPEVMKGLLRDDLGFDGVVVAGPMDGETLRRSQDPSDAAIISLLAGADMILWETAGHRVMKTIDEIVSAVEQGHLEESLIDDALKRVLSMKQELGLATRELPKERDASKLDKKAYVKQALEIERRSITLMKNAGNILPLTKSSIPVGVTGVFGVSELRDALEHELKPVGEQPLVSAKHGGAIYDFEIDRAVRNLGGARTVVCLLTADVRERTQIELVQSLRVGGARVVAVFVGYPTILPELVATADAVVLCYAEPKRATTSLAALNDVLLGNAPIVLDVPGEPISAQLGVPLNFSVWPMLRCPVGRLPLDMQEPFTLGTGLSYRSEEALKTVRWDFGDGSKSKDFIAENTYEDPGTYAVTVDIADCYKREQTGIFEVVVE